jgi:hypothetical protein
MTSSLALLLLVVNYNKKVLTGFPDFVQGRKAE